MLDPLGRWNPVCFGNEFLHNFRVGTGIPGALGEILTKANFSSQDVDEGNLQEKPKKISSRTKKNWNQKTFRDLEQE